MTTKAAILEKIWTYSWLSFLHGDQFFLQQTSLKNPHVPQRDCQVLMTNISKVHVWKISAGDHPNLFKIPLVLSITFLVILKIRDKLHNSLQQSYSTTTRTF